MAVLASRLKMSEGQLYTAVIALVIALLLTVTGLPSAHKNVGSQTPTFVPTPTTRPASR